MSGKKKQNPTVVRNRRVMIYTFLLILTLLYISGHMAVEKQKKVNLAANGAVESEDFGESGATGSEAAVVREELAASGELSENKNAENGSVAANETGESEAVYAGKMEHDAVDDETRAETDSLEGADNIGKFIKAEEGSGAGESNQAGAKVDTMKDGESTEFRLSPDDLWCLILTNAEYPVPEDYEVELKKVPGTEQYVDERIYDSLMEMIDAMKAEGLSPVVCSGYRTLDKQEKLFNRKVQSYVRKGHSKQESYELARQTISIPGSGEHCLGLAVDFYTNKYHQLETGFEKTPEGKWLRENAPDYGFTLRYDRGKEDITGIQYEPWHFRYVGVNAARYLKEHDLSLEEFYIQESLYG